MLEVTSQNNPLTPQMIKRVMDIISFPTDAYAAKLLWDQGIRKEHLHPYLSTHSILNNVYNILSDAERGSVFPTSISGNRPIPIEKLPDISQLGEQNAKGNQPKSLVAPGV